MHGTRAHPPSGDKASAVEPGRPRFPVGISHEARRLFKALCGLLEKRGHLTTGDGELIRLYVILHDRQARAQAALEKEGEICEYVRLDSSGVAHPQVKPNIALAIAERAEKQMVTILVQLGLTPRSRDGVKSVGQKAQAGPPQPGTALYLLKEAEEREREGQEKENADDSDNNPAID